MPKKTPDYDNVFKTLKSKYKRLFISVINETFGKNYPKNTKVELLPSEGYLTEWETTNGSKHIEVQISDFLIKIGNELYLLECQSYEDGSMVIRLAEYAFIAARNYATWNSSHAVITMPRFSVVYIKQTDKTPKSMNITFRFPDGQEVDYQSDMVILDHFTKEELIEKRLFPYIPFYIARYEKEIVSKNGNIEQAVADLSYFRDELIRMKQEGELSDNEMVDLMGVTNTIMRNCPSNFWTVSYALSQTEINMKKGWWK